MESTEAEQREMRKLICAQDTYLGNVRQTVERLRQRDPSTLSAVTLRSRLDAIEKVADDAYKRDMEISAFPGIEEHPYRKDRMYMKFLQEYEDAHEFILDLLPARETATTSAGSDSGVSTMRAPMSQSVQIPQVKIPTFSGKQADWVTFRVGFQSLVNDIPNIRDATRLKYLISALQGPAADIVANIDVTDENYAHTWDALIDRYDNPWKSVKQSIDDLDSIPAQTKNTASSLATYWDNIRKSTRALEALLVPVESWDLLLVHRFSKRLPPATKRQWDALVSAMADNPPEDRATCGSVSGRSMPVPTMEDLERFIKKQIRTLDSEDPNASPTPSPKKATPKKSPRGDASRKPRWPTKRPSNVRRALYAGRGDVCPLCTEKHPLWKCRDFQKKPVRERRLEIIRLQRCFNCFGDHVVRACKGNARCKKCNMQHHTQLHDETKHPASVVPTKPAEKEPPKSEEADKVTANNARVFTAGAKTTRSITLLATARVDAITPHGTTVRLRALLDQGAETSFISESAVQLLELNRLRANVKLSGLGDCAAGTARFATQFAVRSVVHPDCSFRVNALILPRVTGLLPATDAVPLNTSELAGIELADPKFFASAKIDLIIGAELYASLLRPGLLKIPGTRLVAQDTALGWIVSGVIQSAASRWAGIAPSITTALHCSVDDHLNELLQRFWEVEEVPSAVATANPEDSECEEHFRTTHKRGIDGRFTVSLPIRGELPLVGDETRRMALSSLSHVYRRFIRDPALASAYQTFMHEYEHLGHMERVPGDEIHNARAWYLPHHPVLPSSTAGGKVRVVFDASRQTRDGHALNSFLKPGPALQGDLALILLNWQRYRHAYTADIVKMFRQIRVERDQRDLQRIVWSPTASERPVDFRLTTVTYGTSCAPFLAIQTLQQLANDHREQFPLAATVLLQNTYVDDIFDGADEIGLAVEKRKQLTAMLQIAGIELDKWAATDVALLPPTARGGPESKRIDSESSVKTLGVYWNAAQDQFTFSGRNPDNTPKTTTRRSILSGVSRLYDPLGWVTPVTVIGKVLMQDVTLLRSDWDAPVPAEVEQRWHEYCHLLKDLPAIKLSRWLGTVALQTLQVHGFSDASERAYAACVYLRISNGEYNPTVILLASKTKIAPTKTRSIPNLELCGAALLTRLIIGLKRLGWLESVPVHAWSDSRVVLAWLGKHPCLWKIFVANRVSFIQTELPTAQWRHVQTKENPADLATRGLSPVQLNECKLWWKGPSFLSEPPTQWPDTPADAGPDETFTVLHSRRAEVNPEAALLARFSSLQRLKRVIAYCLRWPHEWRRRKSALLPLTKTLSCAELMKAQTVAIRIAQYCDFAEEIAQLATIGSVAKGNPLHKLRPFVDKNENLLRVGGRLSRADLTYDTKHPPILSGRSPLSKLLARESHQASLHGGYTLTTSYLLRSAWVIGARRLIKSVIRHCTVCQRVQPQLASQLMGDLPTARITPTRPFSTSGVDYAGPIFLRSAKGRGQHAYKGYIALFVCFATKAIHLECVSSLSAESFLAAFRRFVSRRGPCTKLVSDNATNFKGADKEITKLFRAASIFYQDVNKTLANDGTSWTFIPPSTPHYGGLWEAGVKSVKHHLRRIIGHHTLTFEEMSTVLAEIEACLNSRPISPLSNDVDDLHALTPAHFLMGTPATVTPDALPDTIPEGRLSRYQLLQRIRNNFWRRWSAEYVQQLQVRGKWRGPIENLKVGRLVLVQDDRYPPSKWPLGRIIETHPGPDGLVRVVTIKTVSNNMKRHVARIAPLHLDDTN